MLIEHHTEHEVKFGGLSAGDVFTTREGPAHIKIKPFRVTRVSGNDEVEHRFNTLVLSAEPWATWLADGAWVHPHPKAKLVLGPISEPLT